MVRLYYYAAVQKANEERLWSEAGLACERAAMNLKRRGRLDDAREYLEKAVSAYRQWGAHAKVKAIELDLQGCDGSGLLTT